jgi:hypothetical protein
MVWAFLVFLFSEEEESVAFVVANHGLKICFCSCAGLQDVITIMRGKVEEIAELPFDKVQMDGPKKKLMLAV